jgi:predicted NACHT family NTPase
MDKAIEKQLKSPKLRTALRAYAKRLQRVLEDMGSLSGTGITLSRENFHAPMRLQPCNPETERREHLRGLPTESNVVAPGISGRQPAPPLKEVTLLRNWAEGSPRPLLLLAPFGAGKSVVLETFACEQAANLLDDRVFPAGKLPPPVPLPVRLRAWEWHRKDEPPEDFCEFLFRSQKVLAPYDDVGLLQPDQIQWLLKAKLFLPLFDGLDELPSGHTSGEAIDPRAEALKAIKSLFRDGRFALASRPGYGAEGSFRPEDTHTIRELTSEAIESYIRQRFALQTGANNSRSLLDAYEKAHVALDQLLGRPRMPRS